MTDAKPRELYVDEKVSAYIDQLVAATVSPANAGWFTAATPEDRAAILAAAKACAVTQQRAYVTPADVKIATREVLRARVIDRPATTHEDASPEAVVTRRLLDVVEVP